MEIRAKARRLKSREGLGLIVVDYLQLMSGHGPVENRQVEVSEISRGLKILARNSRSRSLRCRSSHVVSKHVRTSGRCWQTCASQAASSKTPTWCLFIYRDEVYNKDSADKGTAEIIIAKHRNGPTGTTQLAFLDHLHAVRQHGESLGF